MGKEQGDKIGAATQECTAGALETAVGAWCQQGALTAVGDRAAQRPAECALRVRVGAEEGRAGHE